MLSAACSRCPAKKKKQVWSNMHSHKSKPLYDLYIIHTVSSVSHSSPVEFKDVRLSSLHTLQLVFTVRLNSSSSSGGATLLSLFFISTLSFFFTNANTGWQLQKKAVKLPNSFCDCEENSEHQVLLHKESKMWEQNLPHAHRLKYPKLYNVKIVSPKLKQPTSNTWATIIQ